MISLELKLKFRRKQVLGISLRRTSLNYSFLSSGLRQFLWLLVFSKSSKMWGSGWWIASLSQNTAGH